VDGAPNGCLNLERLQSAAARHGGSNLEGLGDWTLWADTVVGF
jgi:hypothetical protein